MLVFMPNPFQLLKNCTKRKESSCHDEKVFEKPIYFASNCMCRLQKTDKSKGKCGKSIYMSRGLIEHIK